MKIAYLLQDFSIGGIESCLYNIARALHKKHEFHFIATHVPEIQEKFYSVGHPIYLGQDWKKIETYLKEHKIDLVQTHNLREYMLCAYEAGVPVVVERTDGLRNGAALRPKSGLDGVIASTQGTISEISQLIARDKIQMIYNGVDLKRFQGVRADRLGFSEDDVIIGRLSRFGRGKNLPLLIEAVIELRKKHPQVKLVMVGDNSKMPGAPDVRKELEEQAKPLKENVVFTGNVEFPESLIMGMDIVTCVSNPMNEGIPNSLLEGMAAKKPVVSTRVDDIPEAVEDGRTGFLVPPQDVEALACALEKLVIDPALRQKMGEAGFTKIERDFNNEKQPELYEKLYLELLDKKRGAPRQARETFERAKARLLWRVAKPIYRPLRNLRDRM